MSFDVGHLVAGRGRDRLQRANLIGNEVLDLRRFKAGDRTATKTVQIAIAWMRADTDPARFRKLHRLAHDVGITGVEAAGDVHGGGKLDHGGVVAHFPSAKSFTEIAIEIDGRHVVSPCTRGSFVGPAPGRQLAIGICHVVASMALTAAPATLASLSASMLR